MLELRPYQERLLGDVRTAMGMGKRSVLTVLPTGGGKTVVASELARRVERRAGAVWFLCHRDFLIKQTSATFTQNDVAHGFIAAGERQDDQSTMVCSVDTLKARIGGRMKDALRPSLMVWDEAHHLSADGWTAVKRWAGDRCRHIGLTATPERLDGRGLGEHFEALVIGPSVSELMELGALSPYRAFVANSLDLTGVRTVAGDYNQRQLAEVVEQRVITGDVVGTYQRRGEGRRGVYFCVGIAYSKALAAAFNAAGIPAQHMDGETPTDERLAIAKAFAKGELQILTNCNLMGEGYDLAAQAEMPVTIDLIGMVRPTQSLALCMQQIGRALRPKADGSAALLLDHAGNLKEHGLPDDPRDWSLDGRKAKAKAEVRICKFCQAANKMTAVVCSECGKPLVEKVGDRLGPEHVEGELVEIDAQALALARKAKHAEAMRLVREARTVDDVRKIASAAGYKPGWVFKVWPGELERRRQLQALADAQRR